MNIRSYSQHKDDLFLLENYFKGKRGGVYLEMGALDGITYSNTKMFEDYFGWSGILIEPHPIQSKHLYKTRPNNKIYTDLVSDSIEPLEFKYFHTMLSPVSGVKNTLPSSHYDAFFESQNEDYKKLNQDSIMLKPRTLTEIIKDSGVDKIDLFSLDVEGHELNVLKSFDFSIPIYLIYIETLNGDDQKDELEKIHKLLKENGFIYSESYTMNEVWLNERELNKL